MKTVIVTATIGRPTLERTMASLRLQSQKCDHAIVVDGEEHAEKAEACFKGGKPRLFIVRPHTGLWGGGCYRWAIENLDYDVFMFLDDDNFVDFDHVERQTTALFGREWAFTYRRILRDNGVVVEERKKERFVDTNCYIFKRETALKIAECFTIGEYHNDKAVFRRLKELELEPGCTEKVTVNYTVRHWK